VSDPTSVVVIGSHDDPHVDSVVHGLEGLESLVLDASSFEKRHFIFSDGSFTLSGSSADGELVTLDDSALARGWIRRLAPPDWQRGLVVDSHDAAIKSGWLSLLVAIIRTCGVHWLTDVDALLSAENKLVQYHAARRLGVPVPETIVCSDPASARDALGPEIVVKPLGSGHYYEEGEPFVVYATQVDPDGAEMAALHTAPFLAQRRLRPHRHLRVVTVAEQSWAACIDAANLPLDWRQEASAHHSFRPVGTLSEVEEPALAVARELGLGYSSQDWLDTDEGCFLIDVNPGGQWMFLPEPITSQVGAALACWLREK